MNQSNIRNFGIAILNDRLCEETSTIFVTGLGRSGTTMISRILIELNISMGPIITRQSAEDKEFQICIKKRQWELFENLCKQRDLQYSRWAFKCPALRGVIDKAAPIMRNPRGIIIFRDIVAINQRNKISIDTEFSVNSLHKSAKDYVNMLENIKMLSFPIMVLSYEKALQYPQHAVQEIAKFCGLNITDDNSLLISQNIIKNGDPKYLAAY